MNRRDDPDDGPVHDSSRMSWWRWGLLAVVLVGGYAVAVGAVGLGDVLAALRRASPWWLVVAVGLEAVAVVTLAKVHQSSTVAVGSPVAYRQALNVSMSMFTLTQSLPGGGAVAGVVGVRRLRRFRVPSAAAGSAVALTATVAMATVGVLALVGVGVSVVTADLGTGVLIATLAALGVLATAVAVVLTVLRSRRVGDRVLDLLGRLLSRFDVDVEGWRATLHGMDPPGWSDLLRIMGWSSVNWIVDIAALGALFAALGQSVGLPTLLVGFGVFQVAASVPVTPGGLGLVEAGMVGTFVALGVPSATATTAVLLYRLFATWLPALAGMPALAHPATA